MTYFLDPVTFSSGGAAVVNGTTFIRATITPAGLVTEQGASAASHACAVPRRRGRESRV